MTRQGEFILHGDYEKLLRRDCRYCTARISGHPNREYNTVSKDMIIWCGVKADRDAKRGRED